MKKIALIQPGTGLVNSIVTPSFAADYPHNTIMEGFLLIHLDDTVPEEDYLTTRHWLGDSWGIHPRSQDSSDIWDSDLHQWQPDLTSRQQNFYDLKAEDLSTFILETSNFTTLKQINYSSRYSQFQVNTIASAEGGLTAGKILSVWAWKDSLLADLAILKLAIFATETVDQLETIIQDTEQAPPLQDPPYPL